MIHEWNEVYVDKETIRGLKCSGSGLELRVLD